jgi:hypothetical protein
VIVGGLWWLDWTVDQNRKNASILAVSVGRRRRLPVDGSVPALRPIWLIDVLFHCSFEALNVVEGRLSLGLAA